MLGGMAESEHEGLRHLAGPFATSKGLGWRHPRIANMGKNFVPIRQSLTTLSRRHVEHNRSSEYRWYRLHSVLFPTFFVQNLADAMSTEDTTIRLYMNERVDMGTRVRSAGYYLCRECEWRYCGGSLWCMGECQRKMSKARRVRHAIVNFETEVVRAVGIQPQK